MPRLLDFGIAKIVDPWNMSKPEATRSLSNPMTPSYANPEQLRGENLTTATDIYSLGVILFELLAGRLPYNTSGSLPETLQAIQLEDPPGLGTIDRARPSLDGPWTEIFASYRRPDLILRRFVLVGSRFEL